MSTPRLFTRKIRKIIGDRVHDCTDQLALEEPLEIQIAWGPEGARERKTVAITMRTPGHDRELAAGFLVGEGLLRSLEQVEAVHTLGARDPESGQQHQVRVTLRPGVKVDLDRLQRNFYTTSSCGVCGKTSLEALEMTIFSPLPAPTWQIEAEVVSALPARLREAQEMFSRTGGLHAAGLFTREGKLIGAYEDVGRHNAVDKVVGAQFLAGQFRADAESGRGGDTDARRCRRPFEPRCPGRREIWRHAGRLYQANRFQSLCRCPTGAL
jgi:FdhD protein